MMSVEFEKTRKFWGKEILRGDLIWPDEHVIRFVKRNFEQSATILDFGCGGGRNAIALAKERYNVIAMDYTEEALMSVHSKCSNLELEIKIIQNKGLEVPLPMDSVDGIIADGSLFYNTKHNNVILLENLGKSLRSTGKIWANWRTEDDSLREKGVLLGNGLYMLGEGSKRDGCCYFFCNVQTLKEMYSIAGLVIESLDYFEYTENNMKEKCSYFHVVATKR